MPVAKYNHQQTGKKWEEKCYFFHCQYCSCSHCRRNLSSCPLLRRLRPLGLVSTTRSGWTFFCNIKKLLSSWIQPPTFELVILKKINCFFFSTLSSQSWKPLTLYDNRWRRPAKWASFAFGSLNLHSHSLQWKLTTFPSSFLISSKYSPPRNWRKGGNCNHSIKSS